MEPKYQTTSTISAQNHGSTEPDNIAFYDDTATYYTTSLLNIFGALAFTEGKPFRENMFKNWIFIAWCVFWSLYIITTLVAPWTDYIPFFADMNEFIFWYSKMKELSESFSGMWCCFLAIGCIATILFERIVVYAVCYVLMLKKNAKIINKEKDLIRKSIKEDY